MKSGSMSDEPVDRVAGSALGLAHSKEAARSKRPFDAPDSAVSQARMPAIAALKRRFGRDTVTFAATGTRYAWIPYSAFLSSRHTTHRNELLQV
jgi:hypothetical protein